VHLAPVTNTTLSTALLLISPISVTTSLFETPTLQITPLQNLHAHPRDLELYRYAFCPPPPG
jgi:hypothetical protein